MYAFGSIVLARFPFTDLSATKMRPALVISGENHRRSDLVLAFITSNVTAATPDGLLIRPSSVNALKAPSIVRFDRVVTLETRIIVGKIGNAEPDFLAASRPVFFGVFGFGQP